MQAAYVIGAGHRPNLVVQTCRYTDGFDIAEGYSNTPAPSDQVSGLHVVSLTQGRVEMPNVRLSVLYATSAKASTSGDLAHAPGPNIKQLACMVC